MKRVLIDEGVPHGIRTWLKDAEVFSVQWLGWSGIKNGELIQRINDNSFAVVITNDQQWRHQQNMKVWTFGVIVLSTNLWPLIRQADVKDNLAAQLNLAVLTVTEGEIIQFKIGGASA